MSSVARFISPQGFARFLNRLYKPASNMWEGTEWGAQFTTPLPQCVSPGTSLARAKPQRLFLYTFKKTFDSFFNGEM